MEKQEHPRKPVRLGTWPPVFKLIENPEVLINADRIETSSC